MRSPTPSRSPRRGASPRGGAAHRRFVRHRGARRARASAPSCGPRRVVVVLLPDSGRNYLSKIFDDGWMTRYGFLRSDGPTAGDVLATKDGSIPDLVVVTADDAGARRVHADARARRVAARGRHHHRAAARGQGGVGRALRAVAHGQGVPRPGGARPPGRRADGAGAADDRRGRDGVRRRRAARLVPGGARARRRPPRRHPHPLRRAHVPRRPACRP